MGFHFFLSDFNRNFGRISIRKKKEFKRIKFKMTAQVANIAKKKASLLSLEKYVDRKVVVSCTEGRELQGVLKGFDSNMNVVLGNAVELLRDMNNIDMRRGEGATTSRKLGPCVVRGGNIVVIYPQDGVEEVENPFK